MNDIVFSLYFSWDYQFNDWAWKHPDLLRTHGYYVHFENGGFRADFHEWGGP